MKKVIIFLIVAFASVAISVAQDCFPDTCSPVTNGTIEYSVTQVGCGDTCTYKAYYRECNKDFIIDSVKAGPNNSACCLGTASNSPIVSGYILDEAGRAISLTVTSLPDTIDVYTPSKCWEWQGTVGPGGTDAVLVPCSEVESCCIITYEVTSSGSSIIRRQSIGTEYCDDPDDPCFQICD